MKPFLYIQDITDVRFGTTALKYVVRYFYFSLSHLFQPKAIQSSASAGEVFTIVTNVDMSHPVYTTFILLNTATEIVKNTGEALFKLAYRIRRAHHGLLYHIEKRLAPLIYLSRSQKGQAAQITFEQ